MVLTKKAVPKVSNPDEVVLLIDTSLQGVSIGLLSMQKGLSPENPFQGEPGLPGLIWTAIEPQPSAALVVLSDLIQKGLKVQGLTLQAVKGICVSVGPGSFTGMRIGLAYAFGLGHGLGNGSSGHLGQGGGATLSGDSGFRGYSGISSLEAAAFDLALEAQALESLESLTLVIPSTRTHGFWARVAPTGEVIQKASLLDMTVSSAPGCLAPWVRSGEGVSKNILFGQWPLFEQTFRQHSSDALSVINPEDLCSSALRGMARLTLKAGMDSFSIRHPEPLFLRLSTAEEQRVNTPPSPQTPITPISVTKELP